MVVKVEEKFEKTRHFKNNDKSKKYFLRGQRYVRYHDRFLSNEKKSFIYNLTQFYNLYMFKVFRHLLILSNFSKIIIDTKLKFSGYTNFLMGYRMIYHTLL